MSWSFSLNTLKSVMHSTDNNGIVILLAVNQNIPDSFFIINFRVSEGFLRKKLWKKVYELLPERV